MQPRRPTSTPKRMQKIPLDALTLIRETFSSEFKPEGQEFLVEGELFPEEIVLRLGLRSVGGIRQFNLETSQDFDLKTQNPMDLIHRAVEFLGASLGQYLDADGDIEMPRDWASFDYEGKPIWFRTHAENSDLEAQANALLGEDFLNDPANSEIPQSTDADAVFNEDNLDELFQKVEWLKKQPLH